MPQPARKPSFEARLAAVNKEFYTQSPARYFQQRLYAVALLTSRTDLAQQGLSEGLHVGEAMLRDQQWPIDDDHVQSFLTAELQVVLYSAAEALLRLVIAHYPMDGSSPALNLAALMSHREFYDKVRGMFVDSTDVQLDHAIERTIHGFMSPERMPDIGDPEFTPEAAAQGKANLREILRHLANLVLNDDLRHCNNAAKHGFAVRTGNYGFRLGGRTPDDRPLIDQSGDALGFLSVQRDKQRGEYVDQVIVWSNPVRSIALIHLIIDVIDSVWSIGRNLYTGEPATIRLFHSYGLSDIMRATWGTGPGNGEGPAFLELPHMRWPLGISLAPPTSSTP